jgi:hypothetical protein
MNGSLITLLCIAYFALVVCALSPSRAPDPGAGALEDSANEAERVVAFARSSSDHDAESRRVARLISATVLSLQQRERHDAGAVRVARGARRTGRPDGPCTRPRSRQRGVRV